MIVAVILLAGCYNYQKNENLFNNFENFQWQDEFLMGERVRNLSLIPGIDDPAILVNGHPITRRQIETDNIFANRFAEVEPLNTVIDSANRLIRENISLQVAKHLELQPSQEAINGSMESIRALIEHESGRHISFIEGLGMTIDEYLAMRESNAYNNFLIAVLKEYFRDANFSEIRAAADIRMEETNEASHRAFLNVVSEFFERYVDELVEQADIEILDPEIRELLQ